ncbi:SDR family NAD(P)-dependent oxidoreductase [Nocardia sp. NPDC088792]|uniref:SDR family NAD(P)-dependent oxidoreductase n=1 Tax=Nocardia sp. NPDC088792 TaxID=3364332 RepID=UPI0037FA12C6
MNPHYLTEMFGLRGRVAVVTGGSSGIGREIAAALGFAGARVVLIAQDTDRLRATAADLNASECETSWVAADLGDRSEVRRASDEAAAIFGEPDILVNSAGINLRPPLDELTEEVWDATLAVNLTAPFLLGQRFGPSMARRGWGRILNLASQQSIRAFGHSGAYGASKAGITGLTRSQAEAWSPHGVCVNAIAPGFVQTPLTSAVFADPDRARQMAARTMIGRNGITPDYAGIALFLAGPSAAYITGQTVFVDGGFSST